MHLKFSLSLIIISYLSKKKKKFSVSLTSFSIQKEMQFDAQFFIFIAFMILRTY